MNMSNTLIPPGLSCLHNADHPSRLRGSAVARHQARPGRIAAAFSTVLIVIFAPVPAAQAQEILVRHGEDSKHYQNDGIGIRLAPVWSRDLGGWSTDLRPELEINHFRHTGPAPAGGPQRLNQAGAIALLNIHGTGAVRPYAEIGAGLASFSHDRLGHKGFSTHYQFSEHIGIGVEFAERWTVGWRYSHYSNGGIKSPNDGLDFNQLLIGFRF